MKTLEVKKNQYIQPEAEVIEVKIQGHLLVNSAEEQDDPMDSRYFDDDE